MPSPKECALKFPVGSKEYSDCVSYKNKKNSGQLDTKSTLKPYKLKRGI